MQAVDGVWQSFRGRYAVSSLVTLCLSLFTLLRILRVFFNLEAAVSAALVQRDIGICKDNLFVFQKRKTGHYLNVVTMAAFDSSGAFKTASVESLGGQLLFCNCVAFTVNPWGLVCLSYLYPFYLMIVDYPSKNK